MKYLALIFLFHLIIASLPVTQNEFDLEEAYFGQNPPGDTPELFVPGIISTCKEHSAAMFTPDGNEVWFARLFPSAIYFMKQEDGKWTKPQVAPFSGQHDDLYPNLSQDRNKINCFNRNYICNLFIFSLN